MLGTGPGVPLRVDLPPFNDLRVRQALITGTNRQEFADLAMAGDLPKHWWPIFPDNSAYTPLEELPVSVQVLWDYNPDLAIDLLTEALGPPDADGVFFKTTMLVESTPATLDFVSLFKDQMAKIGIEVELDVKEQAAYTKALNIYHPDPYPDWTGMAYGGSGVGGDLLSTWKINFTSDAICNFYMWHDEYNEKFTDLVNQAAQELDVADQIPLLKEAGKILSGYFPTIPLYLSPARNTWQPWINNYDGEFTLTDDATMCPLIKFMWIDQVLKEEMGY